MKYTKAEIEIRHEEHQAIKTGEKGALGNSVLKLIAFTSLPIKKQQNFQHLDDHPLRRSTVVVIEKEMKHFCE